MTAPLDQALSKSILEVITLTLLQGKEQLAGPYSLSFVELCQRFSPGANGSSWLTGCAPGSGFSIHVVPTLYYPALARETRYFLARFSNRDKNRPVI
jgi:hypothetical protein